MDGNIFCKYIDVADKNDFESAFSHIFSILKEGNMLTIPVWKYFTLPQVTEIQIKNTILPKIEWYKKVQ